MSLGTKNQNRKNFTQLRSTGKTIEKFLKAKKLADSFFEKWLI